jgi:hypothetical protein
VSPPKLQPALLGGAFIGVLSSLPYVEYGNLCCCLWVVVGGVLTAYVMQEDHPQPITVGDGATGGLLAGIFGAFLSTTLAAVFAAIRGLDRERVLDKALEALSDVPAEMRASIESLRSMPEGGWLLLGLIGMLMVGVVFATAGGVLGALIFRTRTPPLGGSDTRPAELPSPPTTPPSQSTDADDVPGH